MSVRQWHRGIGIGSVFFLGIAAVTGLLWAYAPHMYWKDGYLKKKSVIAAPSLRDYRITMEQALAIAQAGQNQADVDYVTLKTDFGRMFFEVGFKKEKGLKTVLVDGVSGDILNPLSEALSIQAAKQYIAKPWAVRSAERVSPYRHRSGKMILDAYAVKFEDSRNLEIVIDRSTGQIVEESDRVRRIHFWVMRLHQLQFFGFKKELTLIPGVALLLLLGSGLGLFGRSRKRNR